MQVSRPKVSSFLQTALSIVVPVHNGEGDFECCVASLKRLTAAIDNHSDLDRSTDASRQFAETARENIDLGHSSWQAEYQIRLCKQIQVEHLKHWEPLNLPKAEIFHRSLPWSKLWWRDRQFMKELSLQTSSRLSNVPCCLLFASIGTLWKLTLPIVVGVVIVALFCHWVYSCYSRFAFTIATNCYRLRPRATKPSFSQA